MIMGGMTTCCRPSCAGWATWKALVAAAAAAGPAASATSAAAAAAFRAASAALCAPACAASAALAAACTASAACFRASSMTNGSTSSASSTDASAPFESPQPILSMRVRVLTHFLQLVPFYLSLSFPTQVLSIGQNHFCRGNDSPPRDQTNCVTAKLAPLLARRSVNSRQLSACCRRVHGWRSGRHSSPPSAASSSTAIKLASQ